MHEGEPTGGDRPPGLEGQRRSRCSACPQRAHCLPAQLEGTALAEFERSLISERTRAGMRAAKESGIHTGRPAMLTSDQLKQALTALGDGQSLQDVAAQLKVHTRTLQRALKRHENLEALLKTDRS